MLDNGHQASLSNRMKKERDFAPLSQLKFSMEVSVTRRRKVAGQRSTLTIQPVED